MVDDDTRKGEARAASTAWDDALRAPTSGEADFQAALWQVLAKQTALYTMGESSSIREYDAYRLLTSACYVLGVDPDDPDPTLMETLVAEGVQEAFDRGVQRVERLAVRTEQLWMDVCLSMPLLESVALHDTLESLRDFRARYEPRFFAHEIPADIDYPLCFPVAESIQGADYVAAYLGRLLVECRFLRLFDVDACRGLLHRVHPQYGELIVNLFEPVASSAIGCAIAGCDIRSLQLGPQDRLRIASQLRECSQPRLAQRLAAAAREACERLSLADDETRAYVGALADGLAPRVAIALRQGGLEGVFPSR